MIGKKAQINLMETIVVLFIFFFLLVLAFGFYLRITKITGYQELQEKQSLEAIEISQKALALPELDCPTTMHKDNCIDYLKLEIASGIIQDNQLTYFDLLKYSRVTVSIIYPNSASWDIYYNPLPGSSELFSATPIIIYHPIVDEYFFGMMNVTYYAKVQ